MFFSITSDDGKKRVCNLLKMYHISETKFMGKTTLSKELPSTDYLIKFYVANDNLLQIVALHKFYFDNKQKNYTPVIFDLVAPDSIIVQSPKTIFNITVWVTDSNGINDIENVYFKSFKPDGTTNGNKFYLSIDETTKTKFFAKYSITVEVTSDAERGTYRFEFKAIDKSDNESI